MLFCKDIISPPKGGGFHPSQNYKLKRLEVDIYYTAELDEFWSFVTTKSNQRWTWYAMDKPSGIILAWHNGGRTDADFQKLLEYLSRIPIDRYYSDDWGAYTRNLPDCRHFVGKDDTWKIERKNLNFRIHLKRLNRKTICYSKSEQIHDNVIGMYIQRYYFKNGLFRNSA